jgi:hypothetical protein
LFDCQKRLRVNRFYLQQLAGPIDSKQQPLQSRLMVKGYSVLLAVCSAICPASFSCFLPFCMGQNILANEWIIFMPFICK